MLTLRQSQISSVTKEEMSRDKGDEFIRGSRFMRPFLQLENEKKSSQNRKTLVSQLLISSVGH